MSRTPILELEGLSKRFGGLAALSGVSLAVHEGEIFALIGPNGAGKTTLFNIVTGLDRPTSGTISLRGRPIAGTRPNGICESGVARTFQNIRLFRDLTALDNVKIGCHSWTRGRVVAALFRPAWALSEEAAITAMARQQLARVGLAAFESCLAGSLPYGHQRRLEIARALAARPSLLLLDEPAAGMGSQESEELVALVRQIRDGGVTVLVIEHDMKLVMKLSDRIAVLDHGEKIADGAPDAIRADPAVIQAYLGQAPDLKGGPGGHAGSCWSDPGEDQSARTPDGPGPGGAPC